MRQKVYSTQYTLRMGVSCVFVAFLLAGGVINDILLKRAWVSELPFNNFFGTAASQEARIAYSIILLFLSLYFLGVCFAIVLAAIKKRNRIYLFDNKIIFPKAKLYLSIIEKTLYYNDISKIKVSKWTHSLGKAGFFMDSWTLYIYTNDGKKHRVSFMDGFLMKDGKKQLLEIYEFIKERVPPETELQETLPK